MRLGSGPSDAEEIKAHPWFEAIDWEKIQNKELAAPYQPQLDSEGDIKHFLPEFTNLQPSPEDLASLKADDANFPNFSYQRDDDEFQLTTNF